MNKRLFLGAVTSTQGAVTAIRENNRIHQLRRRFGHGHSDSHSYIGMTAYNSCDAVLFTSEVTAIDKIDCIHQLRHSAHHGIAAGALLL